MGLQLSKYTTTHPGSSLEDLVTYWDLEDSNTKDDYNFYKYHPNTNIMWMHIIQDEVSKNPSYYLTSSSKFLREWTRFFLEENRE